MSLSYTLLASLVSALGTQNGGHACAAARRQLKQWTLADAPPSSTSPTSSRAGIPAFSHKARARLPGRSRPPVVVFGPPQAQRTSSQSCTTGGSTAPRPPDTASADLPCFVTLVVAARPHGRWWIGHHLCSCPCHPQWPGTRNKSGTLEVSVGKHSGPPVMGRWPLMAGQWPPGTTRSLR